LILSAASTFGVDGEHPLGDELLVFASLLVVEPSAGAQHELADLLVDLVSAPLLAG
jgi:hypothetical protein